MNDLRGMTVRDLIEALADAEDATRRARHPAPGRINRSHSEPSQQLAALAAREDLIVAELRRRSSERQLRDRVISVGGT